MVKSSERFVVTITKRNGTYSDGSTTQIPTGYPSPLTTQFNTAAECAIEAINANVNGPLLLQEIERNDYLALKRNGIDEFFGIIVDIERERDQASEKYKIYAQSFLRFLAKRQISRIIYNGMKNEISRLVDDDYTTEISENIKPLRYASAFKPQGAFDVGEVLSVDPIGIVNNIVGDDGNFEACIIFSPTSVTLNRIRLYLWDAGDTVQLDISSSAPMLSEDFNTKDIEVTLEEVANNDSDVPYPTGVRLTTRSGADAIFTIPMDFKDSWLRAPHFTSFIHGSTINSALDWDVKKTATGSVTPLLVSAPGDDALARQIGDRRNVKLTITNPGLAYIVGETVLQAGPPAAGIVHIDNTVPAGTGALYVVATQGAFVLSGNPCVGQTSGASGNITQERIGGTICELSRTGGVDGSQIIQIEADVSPSGLDLEERPSHRIAIAVMPRDLTATSVIAIKLKWIWTVFFTPGGSTGFDTFGEAAQIEFRKSDNTVYLIHDDGELALESWAADDPFWFFFKFNTKNLTFDFSYVGPSQTFNIKSKTAPFNMRGQRAVFGRFGGIEKIRCRITEGTGDFWVGWIDGNELTSSGNHPRQNNKTIAYRWAQIDISDDPVDLSPGGLVALRMKLPIAEASVTDPLRVYWLGIIPASTNYVGSSELIYTDINPDSSKRDGLANGWFKRQGNAGFMLEYSDSWQQMVEGSNFTVEYTTSPPIINWATTGPIRYRTLNIQEFLPGVVFADIFRTIRISEYTNPSSGGIINDTRTMRLIDIVKFIVGLVPDPANPSIGLTARVDKDGDGIDDDSQAEDPTRWNDVSFTLPTHTVKQKSHLDALRELAERFGARLDITPDAPPSSATVIFEGITELAPIDIDPSLRNPHEYVLSMDLNIAPTDTPVFANEVSKVKVDVFTSFPVMGASEEFQFTKVNWALVGILGHEIERSPEVFPDETRIENLVEFAEALEAVYGQLTIEGIVRVGGLFPVLADGTVDGNPIVRLIDPKMENGLDISGIANVFFVTKSEYDGLTNTTKLHLSNRGFFKPSLDRLTELRNRMRSVEPNDAVHTIVRRGKSLHAGIDGQAPINGLAYMGLFSKGFELEDETYFRHLCSQQIHSDGYISYTAFWALNVGTIRGDQNPIDYISIFDTTDTKIGQDISVRDDPIFKWIDNTLHFTYWIKNSNP